MKSSKALLEQDEVVVEVEIAVPPERVFQALTDQSSCSHGGARSLP